MPKEIEFKIIGIDVKEAESRLRKLGARFVGRHNYRRVVFRLPPDGAKMKWLRIRTDGDRCTLTMKVYWGKGGITDVDEYETDIDDFYGAARIMSRLLKDPFYSESRRIEYRLGDTMITLDKWPRIPWLMEIEGRNESGIKSVYRRLGIAGKPVGNVPITKVYPLYGMDYKTIADSGRKKLERVLATEKR
ncbi:MAG: class IV adenylate cyclase [Candidatus Micrarchaeota archaeon]|nr:class IV adenylate cyclase [Candidatus Micrarchaeota archaeon]